MTSQCYKKGFLFGLVAALWAWAFDFMVHGNLLMDLYTQTAERWRPMGEMQSMFLWCVAYHLFMGMVFAAGYLVWRRRTPGVAVGTADCPYRAGLTFGFWVGLLLGAPQLMVYVWMPLPLALPLAWAISELAKWTLAGLLLAALYCKKDTDAI